MQLNRDQKKCPILFSCKHQFVIKQLKVNSRKDILSDIKCEH